MKIRFYISYSVTIIFMINQVESYLAFRLKKACEIHEILFYNLDSWQKIII